MNAQNRFIFSSMTLQEKLKYSGAMEDYPFLEEVYDVVQDYEYAEDVKDIVDDYDRVQENLGNAEDLLESIYFALENDDVERKSYKALKEKLLSLKDNGYWEY